MKTQKAIQYYDRHGNVVRTVVVNGNTQDLVYKAANGKLRGMGITSKQWRQFDVIDFAGTPDATITVQ
jgi:hypothetical protein